MSIENLCSTCPRFSSFQYVSDETFFECRYTPYNVKSIKNCVCHNCLVKTICFEEMNCIEFLNHVINFCEKEGFNTSKYGSYKEYLYHLRDSLLKRSEV